MTPQSPSQRVLSGLRPQATEIITRGAARFLSQAGFAVLREMPLASARRVDLMALSAKGQFLAIEVKSSLADFHSDQKWTQYREYCDALAFAVAPDFPHEILPADAGLILADAYGGCWIRQPQAHLLASARRKALTIEFARRSASRLHTLDDPFASEAALTG